MENLFSISFRFFNKKVFVGVFCSFFCLVGLLAAEMKTVCNVAYTKDIGDLNGSVVAVPPSVVAMSSRVTVEKPQSVDTLRQGAVSVFFIIDHSGSMRNGNDANDPLGQRFSVASALVDTLNKYYRDSAEVGIAIFGSELYFDPTNNSRFATVPGQSVGGYLPFFTLDSSYAPDAATGYTIVKSFLATKPRSPNELVYVPDFTFGGGTNINAGIDAAQEAFKKSKNSRDRQFIIFFSDGVATKPGDGVTSTAETNTYIADAKTGIPTTFTIFFTPTGVAPGSLDSMTNNIKASTYSSMNDSSKLWSINLGQQNLMSFLNETVLSIIINMVTKKPLTLKINTSTVSNYNTAGSFFTFDKPFPLSGTTTPFTYTIKYQLTDSAGHTSDSTVSGKFDVTAQSGATISAPFELNCWERGLAFYNGTTLITKADETMTTLEVRFTWDPGIANYAYTNATVELTTSSGKNKDKETFTMSANGKTFTKTFSLALLNDSQNPTQNNGTLQVFAEDSIIAVFRNSENPKLPLDTLRIAIPFGAKGDIRLVSGFYFDNNADGHVDSIFIKTSTTINDGLTAAHLTEIMNSNLIVLPSARNFTITNYKLIANAGIGLSVTEGGPIKTYVTSDESIEVKRKVLSIGGVVDADKIAVYDKVAPIIMSENFVYDGNSKKTPLLIDFQADTVRDTLIVVFSEPVKQITNAVPFHFLDKANNTSYTANVVAEQYPNNKTVKFSLISLSGAQKIFPGDSIWIHETDRVGDVCVGENGGTANNYQNNTRNQKREIAVTSKRVPVPLKPYSTSPVNLKDINNPGIVVSSDIIAVFNQTALNDLELQKNGSGNYIGMPIQVLPDKVNLTAVPNLEMEGDITIFDAVGNMIVDKKAMMFDSKTKTLNFVWNGKNMNGRLVSTGSYLAICDITIYSGGKSTNDSPERTFKRVMLGVSE